LAVRPTDPEALHLFQLIGAPLLALVQAEAQAAQASADFITRVGFDAPPGTQPVASTPPEPRGAPPSANALPQAAATPAGAASASPTPSDLGHLRVAEFRFDRYTPDGTARPHVARVPVLSLVPIPLLQIKEAEVDFSIRVVSRVAMAPRHKDRPVDTDDPAADFLAPQRLELKGFLESNGGPSGQAVNHANIRVRVRMQQSDLPTGLTKLLAMMTDGTAATPIPADDPRQP
jgi:hypothetical protein